jgi:predicted MPP superfamily phosphohydrolase
MTMSRRTALKAIVAAGVGTATGGAAYGFLYERDRIVLTQVTIGVDRLPPGLAGLRIGLLTDVHRSRWVSEDDVVAAVQLLLGAAPDLIVLGGDYVTWGDSAFVGSAAELLGTLTAPHGVFGILGNHDSDQEMARALTTQHIQVLRDARTKLNVNGETLDLAGVRFWTKRPGDIETVVRGATGTVILLAHDPRRLTEAAQLNVPLVLSGHTHGGQVVLPMAGAWAARKFPLVAGVGRQGDTSIFVSRGVGTVYVPVRINCPPEVALITLKPNSSPA